jgi:nicotinamide-nucleotide amidase
MTSLLTATTSATLAKLKTLLLTNKLSIAVAESVSCGHIQTAIGSLSGSSIFFQGGVTAYQLRHKCRLLGVNELHAQTVNSVSQQVALEMAQGVTRLFDADIGLATTGYAEASTQYAIEQPFAYYAICHRSAGNILFIEGAQITAQGLSRIAAQQLISAVVLQAVVDYLQTINT